jgi:hypothetical protein
MELRKPPSVSETLDWVRTLLELGIGTLDEAAVRTTLTVLLKHRRDVEQALVHLRVGGSG